MPCTQHNHCISTAMQLGETICKQHNVRFTEIRRRVLELVWESHKPAKAYDILQKLGQTTGNLQPPTVYRALQFLQHQGLIHKINSLNAFVGCTHPSIHQYCYFLICNQCGNVTECCNDKLDNALTNTAKHFQFSVQQSSVEIQGLCENCQQLDEAS